MKLLPLDTPERLRLVAGWMAREENYHWLDFGNGRQLLTAEWLRIATQRDTELLRLYTLDDDVTPAGVVGLANIDRAFRTARIWVVAGEKTFAARGHATQAASRLLALGFRELGLEAINTWIVEDNPSIRIAHRLHFKFIGRQRRCHVIDGCPRDRLWFDLLASEHVES
jgi:RimJ/RimL family protein N-acetyltransferase